MAVNGGAMTISTSPTSFTRLRNSLVKTTASWTVLNIFQLPAMNGVLITHPTLFVRERRHPRQRSAAEELERRSPAGRDMGDSVGDARLLDRRNRIAAPDNRRPFH